MSRFSFPTRSLLAVAAAGIVTALWATRPSWQLGLLQALLVLGVPACAIVAAMHCGGRRRSFFAGVSLSAAGTALVFLERLAYECGGPDWGNSDEKVDLVRGLTLVAPFFKLVVVLWATAPFIGALCVLVHWLMARAAHSASLDAVRQPPTRRWLQFSLRGFLILLAGFSVCLGVVAKQKQDEREAVKTIEGVGGRVLYDWQSWEQEPVAEEPAPAGPKWLRRVVGDDYFQSVVEVSVLGVAPPKEPAILKLIPTLQQLRRLKSLIVPPDLSPEARATLRAALPNCRLWWPGGGGP